MLLLRFVIVVYPDSTLTSPATVQCDDCTNVTIANADDAAQVRKNCKTIKGGLEFSARLNETINLDGVETIEGDVLYDGGWDEDEADADDSYPAGRTPFTIHSSTLKRIEGTVNFWRFNGLEELRFPNLTKVRDGFGLNRMNYLKLIDITKLTHLGSLSLEAKFLTTMKHEGFEGFTNTSYNGGSLEFYMAALDSLDSWFRYPLVIRKTVQEFDPESAPASVGIRGYNFPRLKNITIGWKEMDKIWIRGDDIRVQFGGDETESLDVDLIMLRGNITTLERGPVLKNLTAGALIYEKSFETNLDLSAFDELTNLTVRYNDNLEKIRLPPAAVDWEDVNLDIYWNRKLNLTSEYRDAENRTNRFWYWPQGDMSSISISETPIGNDFL